MLRFHDVLKMLLDGDTPKIRRSIWLPNEHVRIEHSSRGDTLRFVTPHRFLSPAQVVWLPDSEDLFATDWAITYDTGDYPQVVRVAALTCVECDRLGAFCKVHQPFKPEPTTDETDTQAWRKI